MLRSIFSLLMAVLLAFVGTAAFTLIKRHNEGKQDAQVAAVMRSDDYPQNMGPVNLADLAVYPNLAPDSFDTVREAAVYAGALSYQASDAYEYGGMILKDTKGKYWVTIPYTIESDDSTLINHITHMEGFESVAEFHTHPCLPYTHLPDYFSDPDIASILYWNDVGYITNFCNGHVYEFDGKVDKPGNAYAPELHRKLTKGRQVGTIALTKAPIEKESPPPKPTYGGYIDEMGLPKDQ